jgi:hypothetical protein
MLGSLAGFFGFVDALKFFSRLEADGLAGGNFDFFAGAGVASNSGLAGLDAENAKASELNALAAAKSLFERFEDRFYGLLGFCAANVRRGDNRVYDVQLDHTSLRGFRGQMLEGVTRVVKA